MTILDPIAYDPTLADLAQRIYLLEQGPQVTPWYALTVLPGNGSVAADWYSDVTAAAFQTSGSNPWFAAIPRLSLPGLYVVFTWATGAGTTGEVKLRQGATPKDSAIITLAAASSGTITYKWLVSPFIQAWTQGYNIGIEARRTAGANTVRIAYPSYYLVPAEGCTLTGV